MRPKLIFSVALLAAAARIALSNDLRNEDETICQFFDDGDTCLRLPDDDVFGGGSSSTTDDTYRTLAAEFFGVFRRLGVSWAHIIRSYKRIIWEASGHAVEGDVHADTMDEALVQLKTMSKDLEMILSYDIFGKENDDLLTAFLNWAATNEARPGKAKCRGGVNGRHEKINVSMAFRRLQVYNSWMKEGENDLSSSPLSAMSVKEAWDAFSMQVSHDECGRLVWWMDLNRTDIQRVKELPPGEIRRFYTWLAHVMIFDEGAQTNGVVFVNSLSDLGFWQFMTILPLELGIKTDEFMICVVPLNTKLVVFLERPTWVNFAYSLLKVFLKKKMRSRVVMVPLRNQQKIVEHAVGKSCIPDGFNDLEGTPKLDTIIDRYFETAMLI